jgi:hypothetical protein
MNNGGEWWPIQFYWDIVHKETSQTWFKGQSVDVVLYQIFWCICLSSFDVSILLVNKFFSSSNIYYWAWFIVKISGICFRIRQSQIDICKSLSNKGSRTNARGRNCLESAKRNSKVNKNTFTTIFKIVESIRFVFLPTCW